MVCFLLIPRVASTDDQSDFRFFTRLYSERSKMAVWKATVALALIAICGSAGSAPAQVPDPELELCRSTGLMALRERNPAIKDVSLDVESIR